MYQEIKKLADEAFKRQNKAYMDEVLQKISAICATCADVEPKKAYAPGLAAMSAEQFEADALATHRAARSNSAVVESMAKLKEAVAPDGYEHVVYGTAKTFDSEAEMIADIQGSPSPVFPLPAKLKKGAKK